MKKPEPLPVDLLEVCIALESGDAGHRWYLDAENGETILVTGEYDPEEYGNRTVEEVEGNPERYRRIPEMDGAHGLDDMRAFAVTCADLKLKESLEMALLAPRPERRFRSVLGWLPETQKQWHAFRQTRIEQRAKAWLYEQGIAA